MVYFGMTYGLIASGKSGLCHYIQKYGQFPTLKIPMFGAPTARTRFRIVSSDEIRKKVYRQPLKTIFGLIEPGSAEEKLVWVKVKIDVLNNLARGINTLLDTTSLKKKYRLDFLEKIRLFSTPVYTFLLVVDVSLETARIRNRVRKARVSDAIIKQFFETRQDKTQQPDIDEEKWDLIYYFNSEENVL